MKQKERKNEAQTAENHILGENSLQPSPTPATAGIIIRIQTLILPMNDNTEKSLLYDLCGPSVFASFCYKETKGNLRRGEGRTQN